MTQANLSAEVTLPFGDGEYLFAIKGKQIENLEKLCDCSISELSDRVLSLKPRYGDVYNLIALGLQGGGMPPVQSHQFMDLYFTGRPLSALNDPNSPVKTAAKIMEAVWFGVEDIDTGKSSSADDGKKKE